MSKINNIVKVLAPTLCFPSNSTYMSVKHKAQLESIEFLIFESIQKEEQYFRKSNSEINNNADVAYTSVIKCTEIPFLYNNFNVNKYNCKSNSIKTLMTAVRKIKYYNSLYEEIFHQLNVNTMISLDFEPISDSVRFYKLLKLGLFSIIIVK